MKPQKVKQAVPEAVPESLQPLYSGKAYFVKKHSYLLSQAFELTIKDGVVISEEPISVQDMPATSIGRVNSALWNQLRGEK
jgi:hypothetical protein